MEANRARTTICRVGNSNDRVRQEMVDDTKSDSKLPRLGRDGEVKASASTSTEIVDRRGDSGGPAAVLEGTDANSSQNDDEISAEEAFHLIFWPAYPRKRCKYEALKAWRALKLQDDDQTTLDAIMSGLAHDIAHEWEADRPRFIPYPSTWLNQHRWEDIS